MGKSKVIVGMSGGLDSSIAALIMKERGYDVTGVTLKVFPSECISGAREDVCCSQDGILSAGKVAEEIGVRHLVIDVQAKFRKQVIAYFYRSYGEGLTPNPCVVCNATVKFPALLNAAREQGAANIATGHYARVQEEAGRFLLLRGLDKTKDQVYFLSRLSQDILKNAVFPLGEMKKDDVRALCRARGLHVYNRRESQEVCFIPGNDYRAQIKEVMGDSIFHGSILNEQGAVVGRHRGIAYYTVGQRKGLNLGLKARSYVLSINPRENTITAGPWGSLKKNGLYVKNINWIAYSPGAAPLSATVKIRHKHPDAACAITSSGPDAARVKFSEPQTGVTPGQAAVFYDGERVLGGGWIDR
jgi:tRNA-specific 2-thiouridylase